MSQYLGNVSAYAYAVEKGYTGTEEEFAELMASYATVGQTAVTAAQTATTKASEAATSATTATNKASEATTAATTATTKAGEATTSAQTASTKASEASQSASTASAKASQASQSASQALTYKTAAESAKTASQTAQGLAETAQTAAETAQGLAEDARDLAQQYAESIDPEHIYSAYPTDTASGAVVSFSDGADDLPLKSLVVDINPVQDLSHGDPSPENICPISGRTEVDVNQFAVNVWDEEWEVGDISASTGENAVSNTAIRTKNYIPVKPNTQYFVYINNSGSGPLRSRFYDINKDFIGSVPKDRTSVTYNQPFTTPDNCYYMRFTPQATYGTTYNNDISINYPSTDHDYHHYTGRSITIPLGQTVYGGRLDVLSGVLTVDRVMATFDGSSDEQWSLQSINSYGIANFYTSDHPHYPEKNYKSTCNMFAPQVLIITNTSTEGYFIHPNGVTVYFRISVDRASTVDEWRAWLAQNNIQLVYSLAEPIEIQLSPNQINSLLGTNNIFADTGDTEVEYRADTKLYIERLTEPDADMIADANITSGSYFMVGNSLYLATANIASGGQVIVGTNCTRKSLAQALNEINS